MENNPPTKCEVLITRKCNLKCHHCNMVRDMDELPANTWKLMPSKLKELGVEFAPIYGAEPLMAFDSLLLFIESCSKVSLSCSVITNGLLLTKEKARMLKNAGLDSITMSVDIKPVDQDTKIKRNSTLKKLELTQNIFRDIEVICTITKDDWHLLPNFIRNMSSKGIWVHFDFYHTNKGQPGSKCSGTESKMPSSVEISRVTKELIKMKQERYLIHPSYESLLYILTHPNQAFYQDWKCVGGSFVTLDVDGNLFACDDYQPEEFRGLFPTLEYNVSWAWDDFIKTWRKYLKACPGCCWITHLMSDLWWESGDEWKKEIIHKEVEI